MTSNLMCFAFMNIRKSNLDPVFYITQIKVTGSAIEETDIENDGYHGNEGFTEKCHLRVCNNWYKFLP